MKMNLNDPIYRVSLAAAGLIICAVQGYFLHQVFIKKKKIRAKWGRFGAGRVLSRFAYASWALIIFTVAIACIYGAISGVGQLPPFIGLLFILSIVAIIASAIYDYSR